VHAQPAHQVVQGHGNSGMLPRAPRPPPPPGQPLPLPSHTPSSVVLLGPLQVPQQGYGGGSVGGKAWRCQHMVSCMGLSNRACAGSTAGCHGQYRVQLFLGHLAVLSTHASPPHPYHPHPYHPDPTPYSSMLNCASGGGVTPACTCTSLIPPCFLSRLSPPPKGCHRHCHYHHYTSPPPGPA